ncbi:hypothetical protein FNZ07_32965 [Paraburkholderia megapolitana]|uniref:Uncharacterized protein n=1 Tax=Paraburkholderia megapolitana TaxID=420953 RepID=A0A1I3SDV1_9BURK|nr:hypothetical protein FNZ07_32965 [Paraburkholderia megapolitana]SFJ55789.1 hypothetical protein SAMN05192543_108115 [Paraburkholderia megapolitana]
MNKKKWLRVALIITAVALYRVYTYVHHIQTGCMQVGAHQRCRFENAANFEGLLHVDLLFTCGWVAGAILCWLAFMWSRKKGD